MSEPLSESSLIKALERYRAEVEEVPEGKEWRMVFVTRAQYGQELQALMDQGLSQLEAFLIAPPGPGLRMMLVDKEKPLASSSSPV